MAETLAPELTLSQILDCADAFHRRTGRWPISSSGVIPELLGETWRQVDRACAGLAAYPVARRCPSCWPSGAPSAIKADCRRCVGEASSPGPTPTTSAPAPGRPPPRGPSPTRRARPGGRWTRPSASACAGLPGGTSLPQLLALRRGLRNLQRLPRLTEEQVLAWADAHHRRTGAWPDSRSGPITGAEGETWSAVCGALHIGRRGLPGGSSLGRLLAERRGVRLPSQLPPLTLRQVRASAQAHRRRTGAWPTPATGPVLEAPGETWQGIHSALCEGHRGLPGGRTLAGLLNRRRSDAADSERSPLTIEQVLAWADAHHERTGAWPHSRSGPIRGAHGETWRTVDSALRRNRRGLAGGWTLVRLLAARRGWRTQPYLPRLTIRRILAWADAHHQRTGAWPVRNSGPIADAPGETWRGVDDALRHGLRRPARRRWPGAPADRPAGRPQPHLSAPTVLRAESSPGPRRTTAPPGPGPRRSPARLRTRRGKTGRGSTRR